MSLFLLKPEIFFYYFYFVQEEWRKAFHCHLKVNWGVLWGIHLGTALPKRKMCSFQGIDLAKHWSLTGLRIWSDFPASFKQREKLPTAMQFPSPMLDPPQRSHATLLIPLCPFITADLITASTWGL